MAEDQVRFKPPKRSSQTKEKIDPGRQNPDAPADVRTTDGTPAGAPPPGTNAPGLERAAMTDFSNQVKKRKKEKRTATLSEAEEEHMLEWLREHPEFYNKKLQAYKNIQRKESLWQEKAADMGKSVEHLKTWYRSMRTRMSRLLKTKYCDDLTDRDVWVIENLSFLRVHIEAVNRRPVKTIAESPGLSASRGTADPVTTTPTSPTAFTTRFNSLLSTLEDRSTRIIMMQQQLIDRLQPEDGDQERVGFLEWVRATVLSLEQNVWRRTQREMIDVLSRAVSENDAVQQSDGAIPTACVTAPCPADFCTFTSTGDQLSDHGHPVVNMKFEES